MVEHSEELSPDGVFRLHRYQYREDSGERLGIVLELASTGQRLLELDKPAIQVLGCSFAIQGTALLLHLRLANPGRGVHHYPATIDLATGYFHHHPDPRQSNAPAGIAAHLVAILNGATDELAAPWAERAPGWPLIGGERVATEPAHAPPPTSDPPAAPEDTDEEAAALISVDGSWCLEFAPQGERVQARILATRSRLPVIDYIGSRWSGEARFNPSANQLWLNLVEQTSGEPLNAFIDLDCQFYWDTDRDGTFISGGQLMRPLPELQQRIDALPARVARDAVPPAAQELSVESTDGRYRVELQASNIREANARGQLRPYYHARFFDVQERRLIFDTRQASCLAWLRDATGMNLQLCTPGAAPGSLFVSVNVRAGNCGLENFREPLGEDLPLARLREII